MKGEILNNWGKWDLHLIEVWILLQDEQNINLLDGILCSFEYLVTVKVGKKIQHYQNIKVKVNVSLNRDLWNGGSDFSLNLQILFLPEKISGFWTNAKMAYCFHKFAQY